MTAAPEIAMPKERPILFSRPMVRAILEGRKTQTRRLVTQATQHTKRIYFATETDTVPHGKYTGWVHECDAPLGLPIGCPYGQPGDRLWVKESWARRLDEDHIAPRDLKDHWAWYWADPQTCNTGCAGAAGRKRPSIHMPRWASRITLEVTSVRVERLGEITDADARAEGLALERLILPGHAPGCFARLWDDINGKRAPWSSNPFVWAISFRVTDRRDR